MSGLQSKCVFGSAFVHALLLALLVVSSAFVKQPPPPEDVKFIKMFSGATITDDETSGGGNPNATPPVEIKPAPAPAPAPEVKPAPVAPPEVKAIEPVIEKPVEKPVKKPVNKPEKNVEVPPEPVKKKPEPIKPNLKPKETKAKETKAKETAKITEPPPKPKHTVEVDLTTKVAKVDPEIQRQKIQKAEQAKREAREAQERIEAEAREQARAYAEAQANAKRLADNRRAAVANAIGNVESKLSGSTAVEMPGPGGEAFINYADLIWNKYYQAWQAPEERGRSPSVRVEIEVSRDGRVLTARIISRSGDATMDKSVQQAIDRVRTLPAFPEGARDERRTFRINFTLKAKRQLG